MNNNKIVILSIVFVIVAVAATGLYIRKHAITAQKEVIIRVVECGTTPTETEILQKLTGRDIFEEQGIKLQRIPGSLTAGWSSPMALVSGQIDVGGGSLAGWINIRARGGKIKAMIPGSVVTGEEKAGLLVLEGSSIHTVKDLVGKSVAVNILGLGGDYHLKLLLKRNGVPPDKVQIVVAPIASQIQLLMSKQVDAVANTLTRGIEIDRALDQGGVRLIPGTSAYDIHGKEYASTPSGFREDFIKEHPDTVRKYVAAVETTRRLVWDVYIKDPQRVAKAYAEVAGEKGGNPELAKYYRPAKPGIYLTDDDVQWWLDVMEAEGQLKHGQIKASDVYTNEFSLAYKELKNKGEIK